MGLSAQIDQIRTGGFPVLIRKLRNIGEKTLHAVLIILTVPFALLMRLIRPIWHIRIGELDVGRIGGLYPADWYLSSRHFEADIRIRFDIFYYNSTVCNDQWLKMWKRVIRIAPIGKLFWVLDRANQKIPGAALHRLPGFKLIPALGEPAGSANETLSPILKNKKPNLFFTPKEEQDGRKGLASLNMPPNTPFVCFHCRDAAYLNTVFPETNWGYHDFRDSRIDNYVPAMEKLVEQGYYAVRMGHIVREELRTENDRIIDYASNGNRSEFMDIYLGAKCRFFLCSDTGISIIPEMFRIPTVYVNWVPIARISPWVINGLFIPKKLYRKDEDRYLTFKEIIHSELGHCGDGEVTRKHGIRLEENSPEEIETVVLEMENRLCGTWQPHPDDEDLQHRFWDFFGKDRLISNNLRMGADYLRKNRHLLE